MTVSVEINIQWHNERRLFEKWFKAYGFTITSENADVIVIDCDAWKNTPKDTLGDSLIVIISSHDQSFLTTPPDALLLLIPIEYDVTIERIIEIHKLRQMKNDKNESKV